MKIIGLTVLPLALLTVACSKPKPDTAAAGAANVTTAPEIASSSPSQSTPPPTPVPAPASADFSTDSVPISNAPLGKFPYFGLPPKYAPQNTPRAPGFGHFPFWTGKAFRDVEGQTYMVTIVAPESRDFNTYELKRNMQTLFQQAGAVKISEAKIPAEALKALPENVRQEMLMGLGDVWNDPAETWVIHRPTDEIWIHYTTNTAQASLAVVETKPFVQSAALLPADQLKADLDKTGKAVLHVNFATDQATILPTSKSQLDAVIALLNGDSALKLAINGYTDDTGSDAHNLTLSDQRAKAVQAALVGAGIKPDRLQARGFGRTNPVLANSAEDAKAANRRVELVKL